LNSDGLLERDEPPVKGIKIWLGKEKSCVTDILGYYQFANVKARKAYLNLDTSTIPAGFTLTVPAAQEAALSHGKAIRVDFGVASRSEITGIVFEDVDGDSKLGMKDLPVHGVVMVLEDGTRSVTDDLGRYFFRRAALGSHTLTLDLSSLPGQYIPTVPIFKDLELYEGVSYTYNIPLQKGE
jgi:hypothetical protein